ncbi:MAG: putative Thioredoxin-disulfide reductase [Verrucomicrobiales bacterium]|nr:putative Thioredoxin-disulfide reductase [Verrucomicrobiales bacterium]
MADNSENWDVVIVGGGLAGLSAAIYLGRAMRRTIVIDSGKSMAVWEPDVQNYLGFPEGIGGEELLHRGRKQAERYNIEFAEDEILDAIRTNDVFQLRGRAQTYSARKVILATGIFHIPPEIEGVTECLGRSMYFCKDCDGYRVQGKAIAVYGWNNEAVEYALGMLAYTPTVAIFTNSRSSQWSAQHQKWIEEYRLPVYPQKIQRLKRTEFQIRSLVLDDGTEVIVEALFATRGDVYYNKLARSLGAHVDKEGQVTIDDHMATSIPGLYAAGCVTPANCQMIIAAGDGAIAAQAINRTMFKEALESHSLKQVRARQLEKERTEPVTI